MIQLFLFVAIGIALLLAVVRMVRGSGGSRHGEAELPRRELLDRICAAEDQAFVSERATRGILKVFLKDRRGMALAWVTETRRQAMRLVREHLRAAGRQRSLEPATEVRLLFHTLLFLSVYALAMGRIGIYGAFWPRGSVRHAVGLAGRLSSIGSRILADVGGSGIRVAASQGAA